MKKIKATLIGVPLDLGAENLGVDIGPNAFRYEEIKEKLESANIELFDAGNVFCNNRNKLEIGNPKAKYLQEIVRISNDTAKLVDQTVKKGEKVIVLGGDHSVSLGSISGASVTLKQNLGLIYFDAHGDMNTDKTTLTGNIHGMHLAALLGFGHKDLTGVYGKLKKIDKKNLLHIGGCDLDQAEIDLIEKEKLSTYQMMDVLSFGLNPLFKKIDNFKKQVKNIWVSLDLDVIDVMYAPGAGMGNQGGLNYREIATIAGYIGKNCNVIGVDLVEYNPLQDVSGKTAELGIELIAKFLGSNYSWYTNYLRKNKLNHH
ncbi:arginase [Candidatus Daviesbacteria bacterium]|nr:arginase [Candidatus Daviesbacteria bacterium]